MMTVLGCITNEHNIWLVLVAAVVCVSGSWAVVRLFCRAASTAGAQRWGWHFLTSIAAGSAIWCTHFIAMLAYDPGVPVGFDPILTMVSLLIAIGGAQFGFVVAAGCTLRQAPLIGGALVGLAIAAMHYTGMMAYRVQGIIWWKQGYLIASVVLSVCLSSVALHVALRSRHERDKYLATAILTLAIIALHFTGMTAFQVTPMSIDGAYSNPVALQALALAVALGALLIVGAGLVSYLIDGSARSEAHEKLRRMALSDSLTGLPNRASFLDHLAREIDVADATGGRVALIGIDLDRFKEINDLRGHSAGDLVLQTLAERLRELLREREFVARLGGDEFAVVHRLRDHAELLDLLNRLETALFEPIACEGLDVVPGASMGVALYPDNAHTQAVLIGNADLAMYRAKGDIARAVCFYEESMDEHVRARRVLASELRDALERNELDIHYQVQTSVATGRVCGYEALVRWPHAERGYIPPVEFIPLAEESGLILQLGEWVLRTACARAASWEPPYKVAVNLSPVQFAHADLPNLIQEVLVSTGLSAERLELELTESTIFHDKERSLRMLMQIKALGVSIALDDFGTGYSSLDTLRSYPFDKIKLDRSFMIEVEASPQARAIIRAVLALGKSLDIPILAEGIETAGQFALLSREGCDEAQGYLLGRPAPLCDLVESGQVSVRQAAAKAHQAATCDIDPVG